MTLSVYNTLGQLVTTLASEVENAGHHEVIFHGSNLANEVHFSRLTAGSFVSKMKMLTLR